MKTFVVALTAALCGAGLLFAQAPDAQQGKKVYDATCAKCHGGFGRGDGPEARKLGFKPRDFTLGAFKCRSTATGQPPTDADLLRSVTNGLPGTPMTDNVALSETDRRAVVQFVKTLSPRAFSVPISAPLLVPSPPASMADLVAVGKQLYDKMQCEKCHGRSGRGDGPAAASLRDDWGNPIKAYNFVAIRKFKCGNDDRDLFRTLQTGMTGSPMPSFAEALAFDTDALSADQRKQTVDRRTWALVAYLRSLFAPRP